MDTLDDQGLVGDRYRLLSEIGSGGMATVWLAQDTRLNRTVALKRLHPSLVEGASERFAREARAAAALAHPNIVTVFDTGEDDQGPYLVMEYIEGRTLAEELKDRGNLEPDEAVGVATLCAQALAHAHERGIVHRDLKPGNMLLGKDGTVKLADFGIAKVAWEALALTDTATMLGTAAYLSPEQAAGREVTPASDLYSLGVMLYQMLTGQVPFAEDHPVATALAHTSRQPAPPGSLIPVPAEVEAVVMACLEKDPAHRPAGAAELAATLEGLQHVATAGAPTLPLVPPIGDTLVMAVPAGPPASEGPTQVMNQASEPDRAGRRRWGLATIILLLGAAVILGLLLANRPGAQQQDGEEPGVVPISPAPTTTVAAETTTTPVPTTTITTIAITTTTILPDDEPAPENFDEALDFIGEELRRIQQGRDIHPHLKTELEQELDEIAAEWEESGESDKARDGLDDFVEMVVDGREEGRILADPAERLIQLAFLAISLL